MPRPVQGSSGRVSRRELYTITSEAEPFERVVAASDVDKRG
jgi:hypothetical protein